MKLSCYEVFGNILKKMLIWQTEIDIRIEFYIQTLYFSTYIFHYA